MLRSGVQFHWLNAGYRDFDEFLATLEQKKRKNIRAERRKVREAGVTLRRVRAAPTPPRPTGASSTAATATPMPRIIRRPT